MERHRDTTPISTKCLVMNNGQNKHDNTKTIITLEAARDICTNSMTIPTTQKSDKNSQKTSAESTPDGPPWCRAHLQPKPPQRGAPLVISTAYVPINFPGSLRAFLSFTCRVRHKAKRRVCPLSARIAVPTRGPNQRNQPSVSGISRYFLRSQSMHTHQNNGGQCVQQ